MSLVSLYWVGIRDASTLREFLYLVYCVTHAACASRAVGAFCRAGGRSSC
jgi:hypothetical protein